MKKSYISPEMMIDEIAMVNCLCLSLNTTTAADDSEVLSKERSTVDFSQDNDFSF